jgi:hypothetical protein
MTSACAALEDLHLPDLSLASRLQILEMGTLSVSPLADISFMDDLKNEALRLEPDSRGNCVDKIVLGRDGRLSSPRKHRTATPGLALQSLHEKPQLCKSISKAMGKRMFATRASYLFYQPGDFIGFHTDIGPCQVTVLMRVFGNVGPRYFRSSAACRPSSWSSSQEIPQGFREAGSQYAFPSVGVPYSCSVPHFPIFDR